MAAKTLIIKQLTRLPKNGPEDELAFIDGINVVVGQPNTGKSKWLQMLDYLFGDKGKPEEAFGDLAEKYEAIQARVVVAGDEMIFERRWKEYGSKSKVFVNDTPLTLEEFNDFLLSKLSIPKTNYPKGNPYAEYGWQNITWRTLLRHVYRQQRFWSDVADKQPESEQLACILQFFGLAQEAYPEEWSELIKKKGELAELEAERKLFSVVLQQISNELFVSNQFQVSPTKDSIDAAIAALKEREANIQTTREEKLYLIRGEVNQGGLIDKAPTSEFDNENLGEIWADLNKLHDNLLSRIAKAEERYAELQIYRNSLSAELSKLERTKSAENLLGALKVTHCPACDQLVTESTRQHSASECFLCGQTLPIPESKNNPFELLNTEIEQLKGELREAQDLLKIIETDKLNLNVELRRVSIDIDQVESQLKPLRTAVASIMPVDIAQIDMEIGQLSEQIAQLGRVKNVLDFRETLVEKISELQKEIEDLEGRIDDKKKEIQMDHLSEVFSDFMNTYLNSLVAQNKSVWEQKSVFMSLKERGFDFYIGNKKWNVALGGTLILYFLLAYHYALLRLSFEEYSHYPGLLILDFPPTLENGESVADKENFILEPFVKLVNNHQQSTQVIAMGASFEGLQDAHRIVLTKVWTE